jgi:hypothetical protein
MAVRFGPNGISRGPFDKKAKPDEVELWIAAPSPLQREMAMREANSARARAVLSIRREEDTEESLTTAAFLSEMSDEVLVEYLLEYASEERKAIATREVLADEEWKDFTALQDAMYAYESGELEPDPDDPEYVALMEKDKRFGDQILARSQEIYEADQASMLMLGRARLEKRAAERRSDLVGSQRFLNEYERQMCFYACRDAEDHSALFFESAREYAEQDDLVRSEVSNILAEFINEVGEAKNAPRAADGSEQSAPPSEPETSEASTQEDAVE